MRAALETLADDATDGQRVAVLGDMAELGSLTELAHFRIGEQVAPARDRRARDGRARARGGSPRARAPRVWPPEPCGPCDDCRGGRARCCDDRLQSGDVVLVKASRVMGLERVVEGIVSLAVIDGSSIIRPTRSSWRSCVAMVAAAAAVPALDPAAAGPQHRPAGARRRAAGASRQAGHADDGRRAHPARRRPATFLLMGKLDAARPARAGRDARVRDARLRRRLREGRSRALAGADAARQALLAGG